MAKKTKKPLGKFRKKIQKLFKRETYSPSEYRTGLGGGEDKIDIGWLAEGVDAHKVVKTKKGHKFKGSGVKFKTWKKDKHPKSVVSAFKKVLGHDDSEVSKKRGGIISRRDMFTQQYD